MPSQFEKTMKRLMIGGLIVIALSGCAHFRDMSTEKGSYIWCYHQPQPVPACRNYNLYDEDDA